MGLKVKSTIGLWAAMLPVVLAGVLLVAGKVAAQAKPPLKIGAYLSATGPASFIGDGQMKTLQLYVDLLNKAGGVDGRRIELFAYDDESNAARANTMVKRLISSDEVHVVIGGSLTGPTMSAVPLVESAGIPMLSLAGASVVVDPIKKFVFKMNPTDTVACGRLFDHMLSNDIKKIGVIAGTDAFGRASLAACRKLASETGINIVRDEAFNPKDTDMTIPLTKLRQESSIQAILNLSLGEAAVMVTRSYRQLGITLPHYATHALASDAFIEQAGVASENLMIGAGAILVWDQLAEDDPQRRVVRDYVQAYKEKFGVSPGSFDGNAYDALMLIRNVVLASGSVDPGKIRDGIENTRSYLGVTGIFRMSDTDHVGLGRDALRMVQVQQGKWVLLPEKNR